MSPTYRHGAQNNRLYRIWHGVMGRSPVTDPRVLAIYQGVGTHDPAWSDFLGFKAWAEASGYADHLSIVRIDNNGGYWPSNCRWATTSQQANNKTNNVRIEVDGRSFTLAQAAVEYGVTSQTIQRRIAAGWPVEAAVRKMGKAEAARTYSLYASSPRSCREDEVARRLAERGNL